MLCCALCALSLPRDLRALPEGLNLAKLQGLPALKVGDVLLRYGLSVDSYVIAKLSESRFSHVGMVAAVSPDVQVIHATTDDDPLHQDQVILSPLSEFVYKAKRFAIKRYDLPEQAQDEIAKFLYSKLGEPFVLDGRKESLYCATLLRQALAPFVNVSPLVFHHLNVPGSAGWYLFPEDFWQDQRSQLLYQAELKDP